MVSPSRIARTAILAALVFAAFKAPAQAPSQAQSLPPNEPDAAGRLAASPRHGEWVSFAAGGAPIEAWVVYPERPDKAPTVLVVHEIFGLSDWVRAVADQFAADGFIAIAPDFLSGKGPGGGSSRGLESDKARALIPSVSADEIWNILDGAAAYATALPAATGAFSVVGYCWGGGVAFGYATRRADLSAAVVYYGTSPSTDSLKGVKAPVLGQYGGNDARVNATIGAAEAELKRLGARYEYDIYPGAGHGFLRQQSGQSGANLKATEASWPRVLAFLRAATEPAGLAAGGDGCEEFCVPIL